MSIVFFCSHCGARFEVGEGVAGKAGRCKRCGEKIQVPAATERKARPAPEPVAAGVEAGGTGWLERMGSQVGLAPLTVDRMPGVRKRDPKAPPIDDDLGDSKPYGLVTSWKPASMKPVGGISAPAGEAKILWRQGWGSIQRWFRRINEFAYLLSVPFIILMLLGASMHNRSLAWLGAEAVVLLNIGRVVTGVANILAIPFREGPTTGFLFLLPPFTIKYMIDNWKKLRHPVRRVVAPMLTIAAVVLALVLLPSLSGRGEAKAADRQKSMILGR